MAYTHTTNGALITQLAARLNDPDNIFWTFDELRGYIKEALYLFSALTGFWRRQGNFSTIVGQAFYNIHNISTARDLLNYTLVDTEVITSIQHHLLEPAPGNSWSGSSMFDLGDVTRALTHRRDQFLAETGVVLSHNATAAIGGPPASRVALNQRSIDVRRIVWQRDSDSVYFHLWREDEASITAYDQSWLTATNPPLSYSVSAVPPLTIQLAPPASVAGTLDLVEVITSDTPFDGSGILLDLPDHLVWAVKWGAMADLLGHGGEARDPRADFCEERFRMGVALARNMSTIIHADIDGVPTLPVSLADLDAYRVDSTNQGSWQNEANGTPDILAIAGHNLVALSPPPDSIVTVTLDVVESRSRLDSTYNTSNTFDLQIGKEDLGGIINYAEHLAAFKMGGAEWNLTQRQAAEFMSHAVLRNQLMEAGTRSSLAEMFALSRKEEADRPRRVEIAR